jgi:hypothetical protein
MQRQLYQIFAIKASNDEMDTTSMKIQKTILLLNKNNKKTWNFLRYTRQISIMLSHLAAFVRFQNNCFYSIYGAYSSLKGVSVTNLDW